MPTIVTSNNTAVFRELGSPAFSRLGLTQRVVKDGEEALQAVRRERPAVAILDAKLPGLSGIDACRRIKEDPELRSTRVVIVLEGGITAEQLASLSEARCDEVLVAPAPGQELFHRLARLLGAPHRVHRRIPVDLRAELEDGPGVVTGHVVDLGPKGARLELPRALGRSRELRVRLSPVDGEPPVMARARVVWERPAKDGGGVLSGVTLEGIGAQAAAALQDLTLFELERLEDGLLQVTLQGEFVEHTDFTRLLSRVKDVPGVVQFDVGRVTYLNSTGVRRWTEFLREVGDRVSYRFVRCSMAFVAQASMVPQVVGSGGVDSFYTPYACDECDHEEERLLQTTALVIGGGWPPEIPDLACPACGGRMVLDDIPARYLAFLEKDPRLVAGP